MKFATYLVYFALGVSASQAASVYSFTSASTTTDSDLSVGFVFSTNSAVTITSLGYFDADGAGFQTAHTIGVYDSSGTLLVSSVLDAGTSAALDGQFRFQAIDPLTLAAGGTYTIAGTTGTEDEWAYGTVGSSLAGFSVDPRIRIAEDASRFVYQPDDTLQYPTEHYRYSIYAGPSFEIAPPGLSSDLTVSDTPEPGSWLLTAAGFALLLSFYIRARKTSARASLLAVPVIR